ncbi:response regulator transcription factor [Caenimonas soli]|uniref:response regulator transcription factor n=1 Tax=Caenimonas soli TaxID=2735555 RepID=UPI0015571A2C|nr:response regulator transcription factor [Caenimonas soli]NPC57882.1 response regulator transcription factor [Caenimonas soli]
MFFSESIKVLVLHRDALISAGVASALGKHPDLVVREPDALQAVDAPARALQHERMDVIVADYDTALEIMSKERLEPAPRGATPPNVLIVTRCETQWQIRHALEQGVRGYLLLGCSRHELAEAVRGLHRGERYLGAVVAQRIAESLACEMPTGRELDVLRLLARGHGNKAIALKLNIAVGTVKSHVKAILQKLDAATRTEAAAVADRRGLLTVQLGSHDQPAHARSDCQPRVLHQSTRIRGPHFSAAS